jgi:hypothetical protein
MGVVGAGVGVGVGVGVDVLGVDGKVYGCRGVFRFPCDITVLLFSSML